MAKYIDKVLLLKDVEESVVFSVGRDAPSPEIRGANKIIDRIKAAPSAEVVEVKHGEWQRQNGGFFFLCSVCGKAAATKGNYCHSCGAKMDGGS